MGAPYTIAKYAKYQFCRVAAFLQPNGLMPSSEMVRIDTRTQATRAPDGSVDVFDSTGVWLGWANRTGDVMSTGFADRERYEARIRAAWQLLSGGPS